MPNPCFSADWPIALLFSLRIRGYKHLPLN